MMTGQTFYDALSAVARGERSTYQLTLGKLTEQLQQLVDAGNGDEFLAARAPDGALMWLGDLMSYRGYYSDLAFEPSPLVTGFTDASGDVEIKKVQNPGNPIVFAIRCKGDPALCSTVGHVLERCRLANGATFEGYKGGEYPMDDDAPLWLAEYGIGSGLALMPTPLVRDYPNVYMILTIRPD